MDREIIQLIEQHGAAFKGRLDAADSELKSLRERVETDAEHNAELERKVNLLRTSSDLAANDGKASPAELLTRAIRAEFPDRSPSFKDDGVRVYTKGFVRYLTGGKDLLTDEERKTMQIGVDPEGGYVTPPQFEATVLQTEQSNSVMRSVCNILQSGTGVFEAPATLTLPAVGWVSETGVRAATGTPSLGKLMWNANEIYAMPEVTQRLLDDAAIDMEAFLGAQVGQAIGISEDNAFLNGDGLSKPKGLLQAPISNVTDKAGTRPFGTVQYVGSGVSGGWPATDALCYDFLTNIVFSLKPAYRRNATWLMPTSVIQRIAQIKSTTGQPIWQQSMAAGQPSTLLGYPVREAEQMPDVAANSLSIAFGDFKRAYWIIDRIGIRVLRDPFTNKPFVRFYTTKRMDGNVADSLAVKFGRFA